MVALLFLQRSSTSAPVDTGGGGGGASVSSAVQAIAQGIATAEGYYNGPGVIPYDNNNPGDIKVGGVIATYPTAQDGWNALYHQIELMVSGQSSVYSPSMSISDVAQLWTGGDNPTGWAQTVAGVVGVDPSTPLEQIA